MSARQKSTGIESSIAALTEALAQTNQATLERANAMGFVTVAQYCEKSDTGASCIYAARAFLALWKEGKAERIRVGKAYAYKVKP